MALVSACSDEGSTAGTEQTLAGELPCLATRMAPDGTCCPAGKVFDADAQGCEAVGPTECADVLFSAPDSCMPRWCARWQTADGAFCSPGNSGCSLHGRICTLSELAPATSCRAGSWRPDDAGPCLRPGALAALGAGVSQPDALAKVPPLVTPPGVPDIGELPAPDKTRFCTDYKGRATLCAAADCADDAKKTCIGAGPTWTCPPGFVVLAAAKDDKLPACAPDPDDCGPGAWGKAAQGATLFVQSGAAKGGDGSQAKPFANLTDALNAAQSGDAIAVADGTYVGALTFGNGVHVRGRCAAKVTVQADTGNAVVIFNGKVESSLSGVRLTGDQPAVAVGKGNKGRLERVLVDGGQIIGLIAESDGRLNVVDSVVAGTRPKGGAFGHGASAQGGTLVLQRVRITRSTEAGIRSVGAGARIEATELLVDSTRSSADGFSGIGVWASKGGTASLQNVRVAFNRETGLSVSGVGSKIDARGLLVQGTRSRPADNKGGTGAQAFGGGRLTVEGARISGNEAVGMIAWEPGSRIDARALIVDGTLPRGVDGTLGGGLAAEDGGRVGVEQGVVSGNHMGGVLAAGTNTLLVARWLLVTNTLPQTADKAFGRGLSGQKGARIELHGARITGSRNTGVYLADTDTFLQARGLVVDNTLPRASDKALGRGMDMASGAAASLFGARLSANRESGILLSGEDTRLHAAGLLVDGTEAAEASGLYGGGVQVQYGARATLVGGRITGSRNFGVGAVAPGNSQIDATGLVIDGTRTLWTNGTSGVGATAIDNGARLKLSACLLSGNHSSGVSFDQAGGQLDGCVVRDSKPAVYLQGGVGSEDVKLSDGVLVHAGVDVRVRKTLVAAVQRAGIFLDSHGEVIIERTAATGGLFGLVRQGGVTVKGGANAWFNNGTNVADESGLFVPPPPDPVK